jgi:hypothetical protein
VDEHAIGNTSELADMDKAQVVSVILTSLKRRGDGKDTPIRIVYQYWTLDGKLLAEVDPLPQQG